MTDPLSIFPEEVWQNIFGRLERSSDVLNVFTAFPQFSDIFHKQKLEWLFDAIIPHLTDMKLWADRVHMEDLLQCRLVCKGWCKAVGNFLEDQPNLLPWRSYDDGDLRLAQRDCWDPNRVQYGNYKKYRGAIKLSPETTSNFLLDMESCPSTNSPFVSKLVHIKVNLADVKRTKFEESSFQKKFKKFGSHVRSLIVQYDEHDGYPEFWIWLVGCLQLLPNLRFLYLKQSNRLPVFSDFRNIPEVDLGAIADIRAEDLPTLPSLESLRIGFFRIPEPFLNLFLTRYGKQLKCLNLLPTHWRKMYSEMLPALTEIELGLDEPKDVADFFLSLKSPHLTKLLLTVNSRSEVQLGIQTDLFQWIQRFPKIQNLSIIGNNLMSFIESKQQPVQNIFPSLEYLMIYNSPGLSYDFLTCLPSLKQLQLVIPTKRGQDFSTEPTGIAADIRAANLDRSKIWKTLPKLRLVFLADEWPPYCGTFRYQPHLDCYGKYNGGTSFERVPDMNIGET